MLTKIGTKSILFGYHQFIIHPLIVALAWWKLYGFPWDPRLWVAFFTHDLGYWGLDNMDGPSGELHPFWGARLMSALFDRYDKRNWVFAEIPQMSPNGKHVMWTHVDSAYLGRWGRFSLLHSRFLAKKVGMEPSRLCVADKLAICLYPEWLYMLLIRLTGEIHHYMKDSKEDAYRPESYDREAQWKWLREMRAYVASWVEANKDGGPDMMTTDTRAITGEYGVWR